MIAVALLALAIWWPWSLYPPSDLSHAVFRVAVCLAAAGGIAVPKGRLVRWGLILWAFGLVSSMILATDPWRALWSTHNRNEGAWQAAHYLLLVLVAARIPRERIANWLTIAAIAAACWGVLPLGWVNGRLAGSTGNPLYLAPLLLLGVWAAHRAGWTLLMPVLCLGLALTGSKGAMLAVIATCGYLAFQRWPRTAFCGTVVAAVGIWAVPIPDSGMIRLELGRVAGLGIVTQPWGWGAEGFPFVWDTFWRGVTATGEAWHDRAHSLVMDRAIEWGIHGLIGWGIVVWAAWRRAETPERAAIVAYLTYGLTMFEMMWGAAAFSVLLGYVLRGQRWRPSTVRGLREFGWSWAAVAVVVGAAALAQTHAASKAADFPAMQAAIERWSPIGGDVIEVYLKAKQTPESLEWAADNVEIHSPHATQQAMLLAVWDRRYCIDLKLAAPKRPDVRALCVSQ